MQGMSRKLGHEFWSGQRKRWVILNPGDERVGKTSQTSPALLFATHQTETSQHYGDKRRSDQEADRKWRGREGGAPRSNEEPQRHREGHRGQTRSRRGTGRGAEVKRGAEEAQGGAPNKKEGPRGRGAENKVKAARGAGMGAENKRGAKREGRREQSKGRRGAGRQTRALQVTCEV